jgi:small conductance mechanosensitive channel
LESFDVSPVAVLVERLESLTRDFIALSPNLLAAAIFLLLTYLGTWLVRSMLRRAFRRARIRPALADALLGIASTLLWAGGLLVSAMIALPGLTPSQAIAGLGIGSLAIGLAFRDIFENFLAGLLILLRKPMRINDFIECEGITGQVKYISIRDTYLRRADGVLVMVPNAFLYKNPVRVLTDLEARRQALTVGVAYGEDVAQSRSIIEKSMANLETVMRDRSVQVFAKEFSSSSIDFEVTWWTGSQPVDVRRSRDEVVEAIKRSLDEAGIEIPFPYRTLTFKNPQVVSDAVRAGCTDRRQRQEEAEGD